MSIRCLAPGVLTTRELNRLLRASVPTTAARKSFARICAGHIDRRIKAPWNLNQNTAAFRWRCRRRGLAYRVCQAACRAVKTRRTHRKIGYAGRHGVRGHAWRLAHATKSVAPTSRTLLSLVAPKMTASSELVSDAKAPDSGAGHTCKVECGDRECNVFERHWHSGSWPDSVQIPPLPKMRDAQPTPTDGGHPRAGASDNRRRSVIGMHPPTPWQTRDHSLPSAFTDILCRSWSSLPHPADTWQTRPKWQNHWRRASPQLRK